MPGACDPDSWTSVGFDGELRPLSELRIPARDRGSLLADVPVALPAVHDQLVRVPPAGRMVAVSVLRRAVTEEVKTAGLLLIGGPVSEAQLRGASEIWRLSPVRKLSPVVAGDGEPIRGGRAVPAWRKTARIRGRR